MEVPKPVREPSEYGQLCWEADPSSDTPFPDYWEGLQTDHRLLEKGLIHLTEENANAHMEAIIRANNGDAG